MSDAREQAAAQYESILEMVTALKDSNYPDEAMEDIQNDPLSVEVRSDWEQVGETLTPTEFRILLCTGGPAVQIRGELDDYKQPRRAWIEYQDWGTPWTEYYSAEVSQDVLLTYCNQFWYGE